jgi:mono/diheme cytochrome c family protein
MTLGAVALAAGMTGAIILYSGAYDVSATEQHTAPVYWALETGMRNAVRRRARAIEVPPLAEPALIRRGFILHRAACVQCHGAPGVAPGDAAKGLLPVPNNLAQTGREWSASEIYWVTRYGLKMTGMPAWGMRFREDDLWAVVAFVKHLPRLTVADYRKWDEGIESQSSAVGAEAVDKGNPVRGRLALQQHACTACHHIPGVVGSLSHVGPPLDGVAARKYLAGRLPNSPENMVRWIRDPRSVSPQTLMPDLGVDEQAARDMAAYLFLLGSAAQ